MSKEKTPPQLEYMTIPIDVIDPHPENPRNHPEGQIIGLEASYANLGQFRSFVVWKQSNGRYMQVTSHGITEAMRREGVTHVRVEALDEDTDPMIIKQIMLADNLHAEKAEDDTELLARLLQEQQHAGYDLASLGSDEETLRQLIEATTQALPDEWNDALDGLPDGDKSPFRQMTFTLTNDQADMVKEALDLALEDKESFGETGNLNSNGNALWSIVKFYLEMGKVTA